MDVALIDIINVFAVPRPAPTPQRPQGGAKCGTSSSSRTSLGTTGRLCGARRLTLTRCVCVCV